MMGQKVWGIQIFLVELKHLLDCLTTGLHVYRGHVCYIVIIHVTANRYVSLWRWKANQLLGSLALVLT